METEALRAVDGRVPGRRGRATRRRLLGTARELLESASYRDLKVVDIAKGAGTSPATFYQYFPDVQAAVLALAREVAEQGGESLRALVANGDWTASRAYATAQGVAEGYLEFWEKERALISVMDLGALEGDSRFRAIRTELLSGAHEAFRQVIADGVAEGRLPSTVVPRSLAGVLVSMLAHVAAHRRGLGGEADAGDDLRDAMAGILARSVASA